MFDVVVIGAGVIGGMLARELSRYQLQVCLLEKENDVAMGASKANSGIIHGGHDPIPGTLKAKLNTEGVPLLYETARKLNVHHKNNGSFVCAFGKEEEPMLDVLLERGRQNGIEQLEILTGEQARAMEPNLSRQVTKVLHIPTSGIICPYELTIAAVGNAMDNGVTFLRNFEVARIQTGEVFTLHGCDGRKVQGKFVVNCAGGYSDKIAQMAGDYSFSIIPRAGEYLLLDKTEGAQVSHTIFQVPTKAGKGILVTPTVDGNLLVGPTAVVVETPACTETTAKGLSYVETMAQKSVPDLHLRQVITSFAGVRASVKTGDFIIRPGENVAGFLNVAAIDSPGLTCCVSVARYAVSQLKDMGLLLEEKTQWDGTRENPRAFWEMTEEEKDAFIQKHPDYGRIVCRCETVSEGEIRDALKRNPVALDVDGVKRRTRAGMGRCQGGFCSGRVMKMIAQEQNIPLETVTKSGKGSEILTGKL